MAVCKCFTYMYDQEHYCMSKLFCHLANDIPQPPTARGRSAAHTAPLASARDTASERALAQDLRSGQASTDSGGSPQSDSGQARAFGVVVPLEREPFRDPRCSLTWAEA